MVQFNLFINRPKSRAIEKSINNLASMSDLLMQIEADSPSAQNYLVKAFQLAKTSDVLVWDSFVLCFIATFTGIDNDESDDMFAELLQYLPLCLDHLLAIANIILNTDVELRILKLLMKFLVIVEDFNSFVLDDLIDALWEGTEQLTSHATIFVYLYAFYKDQNSKASWTFKNFDCYQKMVTLLEYCSMRSFYCSKDKRYDSMRIEFDEIMTSIPIPDRMLYSTLEKYIELDLANNYETYNNSN